MDVELGSHVDHLLTLAESTPLGLRGLTGLLGAVLCAAGSRLYPLAIMAPGLLLGGMVATALPAEIELAIRAVVGLVLALVGALICRKVERAAVAIFGAAVVGTLVYVLAPLALGATSPWWAPLVGAVVGLFLFPSIFKALLAPLTAWLGAMVVAWSLGRPDQVLVVVALAAVGTVIQLAMGKKNKD